LPFANTWVHPGYWWGSCYSFLGSPRLLVGFMLHILGFTRLHVTHSFNFLFSVAFLFCFVCLRPVSCVNVTSMSEFSIPNCPSVFSNVYLIFCLPNWPRIALSSLYYIPSRAASTYLPNLCFFYLILVLSKYTIHLYVIYMYSTFIQMKIYIVVLDSS
jgi:hypothetical protein